MTLRFAAKVDAGAAVDDHGFGNGRWKEAWPANSWTTRPWFLLHLEKQSHDSMVGREMMTMR